MEVTEVQITLSENRSDKLRAFATITLDGCFVVRDLKVIKGANGLFLAMPSRRLTARCPHCRCKNPLRARYCNDCGNRLPLCRTESGERGRAKLSADIAHPINRACRAGIQQRVLDAFRRELQRSKQGGYGPSWGDIQDRGPEGQNQDDGDAIDHSADDSFGDALWQEE